MRHTNLPEGLWCRFIYELSRISPGGRVLPDHRLVTICTIRDAEGNTIAQGRAMLRPDEPFNHSIAHEVSLGRARKRVVGKFYSVEVEDKAADDEEARSG